MKLFNIVFEDGCACSRWADDLDELAAILAEEFPGRYISHIMEAIQPEHTAKAE